MPLSHRQLEWRESERLAPFAQRCLESRGRQHPESEEGSRTRYQRDRDRIIHSRAFRRLEYKTQVFLNGSGDHLRTRLTHTMEVAAISRNIARALQLNEDLTEAISLAHDLGHSPFGHNGESVLDELMAEDGGFEHNRQSLRVVELLEQKYPAFPGLNLCWEVREGLAKHQTSYDLPEQTEEFHFQSPCLEAQVSNLADEITYYSHDLDDGLESGLLTEKALLQNVAIWAHATKEVDSRYPQAGQECRRYFVVRCLIDREVKNVVKTTEANLVRRKPRSPDDIRLDPERAVNYSPELQELNAELRDFLYRNLYYHPAVHGPNLRAASTLQSLFRFYLENPEQLEKRHPDLPPSVSIKRLICDHLAGMTDRSVFSEAKKLGLRPNESEAPPAE